MTMRIPTRLILASMALFALLSILMFSGAEGQMTIDIVDRTHDSVTIEWTPSPLVPPGIFEKYELIRYKGCGVDRVREKTITITDWDTQRYTDSGLSPDTQYSYQVGAYRLGEVLPAESSPPSECAKTHSTPIWITIGWVLIGIGVIIIVVNVLLMIFAGMPSFTFLMAGVIIVLIGIVLVQVS